MNVDTLAPLGLSLPEAENQRATKHRSILGLKVTRGAKAIKKKRERELHRPEAMFGIPFTSGPWAMATLKPF
mgnify:FL=1